MDLGFTRLEPARAEAAPIPLDYFQLIASLSTLQAASRTAAVEARLRAAMLAGEHPLAALVELLAGGSGWREATMTLKGSFHPETAVKNRGTSTGWAVTDLFTARS